MTTITRNVLIDASRQQVWDVLADFGNVYRTNKGIRTSRLTSTTTSGVGTERVCDMTMMNAKLYERVTDWQDGRRIEIDIYDSENMPGMGSMGAVFELDDEGSGARLTASLRYEMRWGPVGRLIGRAMKSRNEKGWEEFLAGIKHHVETGETVDEDTELNRGLVGA